MGLLSPVVDHDLALYILTLLLLLLLLLFTCRTASTWAC
jgi:hypothetical protein